MISIKTWTERLNYFVSSDLNYELSETNCFRANVRRKGEYMAYSRIRQPKLSDVIEQQLGF